MIPHPIIIPNTIKQDQADPPNPRKDIEVDKGDGEEMLVAKKNQMINRMVSMIDNLNQNRQKAKVLEEKLVKIIGEPIGIINLPKNENKTPWHPKDCDHLLIPYLRALLKKNSLFIFKR